MSIAYLRDNKGNQQAGFTLVEVLVAMVVFAVGILAVATMQISSVGGNENARIIMDASTLGATQLETLMGLPYNHADLANGVHPTITVGLYNVTWTVTDNAPTNNTKTVQVDVVDPQQKTVTFFSVIPEII